MGVKAILILLLVALGLGAVLYFTDQKPSVAKTDENAVLEGRSLTTATKFRWQFRDLPAIEVGRDGDGLFQIQEPIIDLASMGFVRQMVTAWDTANMQAVKHLDDEQGREKTGLASPEMKFIAEWPDGKRVEVEVGDESPLADGRFLRAHGRIWQGGQGLIESMRVGLDDLREHQVFRHAASNATSVRLDQVTTTGKREPVQIKLVGNDWMLTEPIEGRADSAAAQRFVTAVTSLRVDYFQPGNLKTPEREADIKVEINGAYGKESVDLWLEDGQIYGLLPTRGYIFTSSNQQYGQVFVNAVNNLRARILVPMGDSTFEELVELVIDPGQGQGDRIRMLRESPASPWRMLEPIDYALSPTPVNEAAFALHRLVAQAFVTEDGIRPRANDPRYGMQGARWAVTTRRVHQKEMYTLWFGSALPEGFGGSAEPLVYCCRSDEPDNVAIVPKQALDTLQRSWLEYLDKQIVRQPATIEKLVLSHRDGRTRTFQMDGEGGWLLDGTPGDRSEVGDFANDILRDFAGKAATDMRTGFAEPDWVMSMQRKTGDELGLIKIWDRGGSEPLIAKSRSEEPVGFELNKGNSTAMRAFWQ
jgi:hypothetical protein